MCVCVRQNKSGFYLIANAIDSSEIPPVCVIYAIALLNPCAVMRRLKPGNHFTVSQNSRLHLGIVCLLPKDAGLGAF